MVTAEALIHGDLDRLLGHDAAESPLFCLPAWRRSWLLGLTLSNFPPRFELLPFTVSPFKLFGSHNNANHVGFAKKTEKTRKCKDTLDSDEWTDRHCRYFLRQVAPDACLFTEMVTAEALIHGDLDRLLGHDAAESPLVLQLGGSQPDRLVHHGDLPKLI